MPIKYFGKRSTNFGKPLWEILMNLKDFGKGRIIQRSKYTQIYPEEPTYYRIIRVEPHSIEYPPGRMVGNIWAEVTFRGRRFDEPQNLGNVAFNDDYQLVARHEETEFCNRGKAHLVPVNILPRTAPFPPLWKELLQRQKGKSGLPIAEEPELPLVYNFKGMPLKHVAEEGEEPTVRIQPEHTSAKYEELYQGVIFDRTEASKVYEKIHNSRKYAHSTSKP